MLSVAAADELAIVRVLGQYCQFCDDGRFEDLAALFTPRGSFSYVDRTWTGRDAIIEFFEQSQTPARRGKHLTANPVVAIVEDSADVTSDFVFFAFVDGVLVPSIGGRYHDRLVRLDGVWLLDHRNVSPIRPTDQQAPS